MQIIYRKYSGQYADIILNVDPEGCLGPNVDFFLKYDLT